MNSRLRAGRALGFTWVAIASLSVLLPGAVASAHSGRSVSRSEVRTTARGLDVVLWLAEEDVIEVLGLDDDRSGRVDADELARGRPLLEGYARNHLVLRPRVGDSAACAMRFVDARHDAAADRRVVVRLRYDCPAPPDDLVVRCTLFQNAGFAHEHRATIHTAGTTQLLLFDAATQERRVVIPLSSQVAGYLWHGVRHIALGYDHLVFLFALLLLGGRMRTMIAIVTSFTVAHSITLALGAFEVVRITPIVVESAIALTIAYVGAENLYIRRTDRRYLLTFALGLVHGFGFAGALAESGLPTQSFALTLFSFNLGVELGQLVIVAAAWPLLRLAARAPSYAVAVRWLSVAVFLCGVALFVLRAFFDVG